MFFECRDPSPLAIWTEKFAIISARTDGLDDAWQVHKAHQSHIGEAPPPKSPAFVGARRRCGGEGSPRACGSSANPEPRSRIACALRRGLMGSRVFPSTLTHPM